MRFLAIAIMGSFVLLLFNFVLLLQEWMTTSRLNQRVNSLVHDTSSLRLSRDDWQHVLNVAKGSPDVNTFTAHLARAHIFPAHMLDLADDAPHETPAGPPDDPPSLPAATATAAAASPSTPESSSAAGSVPAERPGGAGDAAGRELHPPLTAELAAGRARGNVVIVTWTNLHFVDFVENWVRHLTQHGVENYLVGAMDERTAGRLLQAGIAHFRMYGAGANSGEDLGEKDFGWGSPTFHKMGRKKIGLLQAFLSFGLDIMLCDSDTVWMKDPTDYFGRYPAADVLSSSDHMWPTNPPKDDGLEQPPSAHSAMNIGVMFFRHSDRTVAFVAEWVRELERDAKHWDQNLFNSLVRQGFNEKNTHDSDPRLFWGWGNRLVVGILPVASFASGHTFHVQHLHQVMGVEPFVVHQTFQYGGTKGKRHRLREARLWTDPDAYYGNGSFLHAELEVLPPPPDFEKLPDFNMSLFHLRNMEQQLLQVRQLLVLAILTGRTVIMPKLQCYCDRYWGPTQRCRLPGARELRLPFVCPLDHVFEPFHFDDEPSRWGPPIAFREHSFLENSNTPPELTKEAVNVRVDRALSKPPFRRQDTSNWLSRCNLTQAEVSEAFPDSVRLARLRFSQQALRDGCLFSQEYAEGSTEQRRLLTRLEHMPGFWCCRTTDGPQGKGGTPYAPMMLRRGIEFRH